MHRSKGWALRRHMGGYIVGRKTPNFFFLLFLWQGPMLLNYIINEWAEEDGTDCILNLFMRRIHIFDNLIKICGRVVVGLPMRCTKMVITVWKDMDVTIFSCCAVNFYFIECSL